MRVRAWGAAGLLVGGLAACAGVPGLGRHGERIRVEHEGGGPAPWTHLDVRDDPRDFHFVVVTDRTGAHRPGVFERGVDAVNLLQPALVVSVGDQIEGYSEDEAVLGRMWEEFEGLVRGLEAPYFHTPGNHDMGNRVMMRVWAQRFGPSYYHFLYKDVLFVVLNSELFPGASVDGRQFAQAEEQTAQMTWLEHVLADHRAPRWTFVFLHQPFWEAEAYPKGNPDWVRVESLLAGRPHTVFAGHLHRYGMARNHEHDRITLATTGGGSAMRGVEYGEFDHVAWVTVTQKGPVVANVLLEGVLPKQLPVEELAKLRERLRGAIHFEPVRASRQSFAGGRQRFELRNPMEVPLRLSARLEPSPNLEPSLTTFERTLAPGETATLEVGLHARGVVPLEALLPVRMTWTLEIERPDGSPYRTTRETPIVPERPFYVPSARDIHVDGRLDEWGKLRLAGEHPALVQGRGRYGGPSDGALRFDVRRDDAFVYLGIDVTDDVLSVDPDVVPYNQDGVILWVDARPEPERSQNASLKHEIASGALGKGLFTALSPPAGNDGHRQAMFDHAWAEGTLAEAALTERGFSVELRIPAALLDGAQGGPWEAFRLNLGVADDDGHDDRTTYWWRPDRMGEHAVPATGTFTRR